MHEITSTTHSFFCSLSVLWQHLRSWLCNYCQLLRENKRPGRAIELIPHAFFIFAFLFSSEVMASNIFACHNENEAVAKKQFFCSVKTTGSKSAFISKKKSKQRFSGKRITLELHYVEANRVFRMLAEHSGYSLLMDSSVNKEISIDKIRLPWDQALYELAEFLNLEVKIYNDIIYVDSAAGLRKYKPRKKKYKARRISLGFNEIEVKTLLTLFADLSGKSLNIKTAINKEMALVLNNIPWNQALYEIVEFLNLKAKITKKNIYIYQDNRRVKPLR